MIDVSDSSKKLKEAEIQAQISRLETIEEAEKSLKKLFKLVAESQPAARSYSQAITAISYSVAVLQGDPVTAPIFVTPETK